MDLNELFARHQVAPMRLASSSSPLERQCYKADASHYARCIATTQRRLGARGTRLTVVEEFCL
jgi:hypothetical protein